MKNIAPYPIYIPHLELKDKFLKEIGLTPKKIEHRSIIDSWDSSHFSDPSQCGFLQTPNNKSTEEFKFIVHAMSFSNLINKDSFFLKMAMNY